jgi:uncharacterized protein (TIGR03083 family)
MTQDFDFIEAIEAHSAGFADAATGNFDARVEHCPDWSVADLVWHLSDVHWFWATIAEERLDAPPDESRRPARPADADLIENFRAGAAHLADVLRRTPWGDHAWTWAPQQDVGFIARHQVQEAAVHHWDAAHAAEETAVISPVAAADAIEEFLSVSLPSPEWPADPATPPLGAEFALRCNDIDAAWTIADGSHPHTIEFRAGSEGVPALTAGAADLLLWLYRRVDLDPGEVDPDLLERFRGDANTD